jgi:hypothetical protein
MTPDQKAVVWQQVAADARASADTQRLSTLGAVLFEAVNTCTTSDAIALTIRGCLLELVRNTRAELEGELSKFRAAMRVNVRAETAVELEQLALKLREV